MFPLDHEIQVMRRKVEEPVQIREDPYLATPGDVITTNREYMRGHGTALNDDGNIIATVVGHVEKIDMLLTMRPWRFRYKGEIGDVVVGRVIEVQHKRWILDVNARLNGILLLTSINLPGGEQRRKTEEDELNMRNYLDVGNLVSAEVQTIFNDGALSLHTRTLKFGKLGQGVLVKVPPVLIRRKKTHFHNNVVPGLEIILSNNGYVWISTKCSERTGGYVRDLEPVDKEDRESIVRVKNCITALVKHNKLLCETVILYAFEFSTPFDTKEILEPRVMKIIVDLVSQKVRY